MKVLVLGTGPIGKEICLGLISDGHIVRSVDATVEKIEGLNNHYHMDIWTFIKKHLYLIKHNDLIINALPGNISYEVIKFLIPFGISIVDVSFMEEDLEELNIMAIKYQTKVIYDCGIAPGLCNIILGHYLTRGPINEYKCWVGGFPQSPTKPYYHKTLFSIRDLLAEYTRPVRYKIDDNIVQDDIPLRQKFNYKDNQYLEAFASDGLRSLLNLDVADMREYTLRYKGHIDTMRMLWDGGFFKPENIENLLHVIQKEWQMEPDEKDSLHMKILMKRPNGETIVYRILDDYKDGVTAMARTTAYSCLAITYTLMGPDGLEKISHGVISPEKFMQLIHSDQEFKWIIQYLKDKDINILHLSDYGD